MLVGVVDNQGSSTELLTHAQYDCNCLHALRTPAAAILANDKHGIHISVRATTGTVRFAKTSAHVAAARKNLSSLNAIKEATFGMG